VAAYAKNCYTLLQNFVNALRLSLLNPLANYSPCLATRPWEIISTDFITGLPIVDGFDYIATFVDSFTTQALFIPYSIHINATQLDRLFLDN
jgi:hypothetical protein